MSRPPCPQSPRGGDDPDRTVQARLEALHGRLLDAVSDLTSADGWQQMLRTAAALPTYSPHNVLLITTQRPDATAVAGFHTWKELGRSVRKGEKGIAILAPVLRRSTVERDSPGEAGPEAVLPSRTDAQHDGSAPPRRLSGFRIVHVFDVSQTDGPDLPAPPEAIRLEGDAPAGLIDGLSQQVLDEGYQLIRHHFDVPHPGLERANGVTDYLARTVLVRPGLSDAQTSKTLAHELGHVLLHAPSSRPAGLTREQAEVEAESVAYIVTSAHGLDSSTYTVPYVAGWAGTDLTLVARTAERVLSTAKTVLSRTPPATPDLVTPEIRERLRSRTLDRHRDRALERDVPDERVRTRDTTRTLADQSPLLRQRQRERTLEPPGRSLPPHPSGSPGPDAQGRLW
jgi:hypothetical protein